MQPDEARRKNGRSKPDRVFRQNLGFQTRGNAASGVFVKLSGYKAFIPNKLPPNLQWGPHLIRSLSDADRLVGQLSGEGRLLPNLHLLMRPFIGQEAVSSSRIEGTQATLGELLASNAGLTVKRSPDDLGEVGNYVKALEYASAVLECLF